MTRNEKIGLLENYSTFLAANGYMDEDWRSEPPYAIDEFLKLTDKPKKTFFVEKVTLLNSFESEKEAQDWMKKVKAINDDIDVAFQIS